MWLTQPCALSPHLARSCAVVGAAAALDADDGVDDLPAAVDLLAFVVGDARQRHLVQHRADARTLRCKKGQCMNVTRWYSSNGPAAKLLRWSVVGLYILLGHY